MLWFVMYCGFQIFRSYRVFCQMSLPEWYYYIPLILRSVVTVEAMKLFVHLKIPATALNSLLKNVR